MFSSNPPNQALLHIWWRIDEVRTDLGLSAHDAGVTAYGVTAAFSVTAFSLVLESEVCRFSLRLA